MNTFVLSFPFSLEQNSFAIFSYSKKTKGKNEYIVLFDRVKPFLKYPIT